MKKSQLRKIIREEIQKKINLNESDYSFDNIRINKYDDLKELSIYSGINKIIELKYSQLPKLIQILKKIK